MSNYLIHYGIPRRSGRYPWGSGERPYQSSGSPPKTSKDIHRVGKKLNDRIEANKAKEKLGGRVINRIESDPEADLSGEAYVKAYRWFERNDPKKLEEMKKQVGSSYDLDYLDDFNKVYDKFDAIIKKTAYDKDTGFLKINYVESRQDRLKRCNPNYEPSDEHLTPYNGNCGNSVIANEMRRRGLDVEARGNNVGMTPSTMYKVFPGANNNAYTRKLEPKNLPSFDENKLMMEILMGKRDFESAASEIRKRGIAVQNEFARQIKNDFPDGSRGVMQIVCDGFSHWMSFDIKDGKVLFSNPQDPSDAGNNDDIVENLFAYYKEGSNSSAIRLDGVKTNNDYLKSMVKNRGDRIADMKGMDWDPFAQDELNNPAVKKFLEGEFGKKWDGSWDYYDPETKKYITHETKRRSK